MSRAYMNWSGGKDSSLCLKKVRDEGIYKPEYLLTTINSHHDRISMHGVRRQLLEIQARSIGLPLLTVELPEQPDMQQYEKAMTEKVAGLREQGFTHSIFGDIFLEDLKKYREDKLQQSGMQCVFPLWKIPTAQLLDDFIRQGFKAILVCVNGRYLDKSFCGRLIDETFIRDLPDNVDPCGENGEYHSFVFDGPIFQFPVPFTMGPVVYREYKTPATDGQDPQAAGTGFWFCDLLPEGNNIFN